MESKLNKNNHLLPVARKLRADMTAEEKKLWYQYLRKYRPRFYKQKIIDNFIVDFYCAAACLAIELDGSQYFSETGEEKDKIRTEIIEKRGVMVLRFNNMQVKRHFPEVCMVMDRIVKERIKELQKDIEDT